MRLLNVLTLGFEEFLSEERRPPYMILSHRWGEDEVSFKEWRKGLKTSGQGYEKIIQCCEFIKARPNWPARVWIDTICIDKRSSAELSEACVPMIAINSMYRWYSQATVCIAYLSDVVGPWPSDEAEYLKRTLALLHGSAWFRRGWTLQELIAPEWVLFCSAEWLVLGRKTPRSKTLTPDDTPDLIERLSEITGIDSSVLETPTLLTDRSIAQRMSWASRRKTTRPEDLAYSLLGLFSVNMPLLYGEGASRAFMRLQLEIIRKSTDESIFAWERKMTDVPVFAWQEKPNSLWNGLLARSPEAFRDTGNIMSLCDEDPNQRLNLRRTGFLMDNKFFDGRTAYLMTNKGLEFRAPAWLIREGPTNDYLVWLACARDISDKDDHLRVTTQIEQGVFPCFVILEADSINVEKDRVRRTRHKYIYDWTRFPRETWQDVGEKCFEIAQSGL
ncbi:hypothetical protein LTR17_018684 [Elasticomyces elasticus]|nr:hypothetical protein LTR17_018684 [Elasticomyces elasticus]